ncbi:MAG: Uma2 family endonuclease [Gemmataceae bacterium]
MDSIIPPGRPPVGEPDLYLPPEVIPNLDELVTEDGKPVDNVYVERAYRLLTEPLYASWKGPGEGGPFIATANVGWFYALKQPPLVPDVLLSLDVTPYADPLEKKGRSYFQWLYDKPPDVVIEIVSDKRGDEEGYKMDKYARLKLQYYVIHDPSDILEHGILRAFSLDGKRYRPTDPKWLPDVELGLTLWQGLFQGLEQTWLRWCDKSGAVLPTGMERAAKAEKARKASERARKTASKARDRAREEAARLREKLRELGVDPDA